MDYSSFLKKILWNPKYTHNQRVKLIKLFKGQNNANN